MSSHNFEMTIGFITDGLPFDGSTVKNESLGGSETALYYVARELRKLGHRPMVCCNCPDPGDYEGVSYFDKSNLKEIAQSIDFDVLIVSRFHDFFQVPFKSKLNVIWVHDTLEREEAFKKFLPQIDLVFALSRFHVKNYLGQIPELKAKILQTRNGVDLELIRSSIAENGKDEDKIIYASRPERGLEVLLRYIWPELIKVRPTLSLYLCGYDIGSMNIPLSLKKMYKRIDSMVEDSPNVFRLGNLPKHQYYRHLGQSKFMLYPCLFPEISCIVALEAQACRTPIITTNDFALSESVAPKECLIDGNPMDEKYRENFIERVLHLFDNKTEYERVASIGYQRIEKQYRWETIVNDWDEHIYRHFQKRYRNNKRGVLKRLIYNSDIIQAKELAAEEGITDMKYECARIVDQATSYRDEHGLHGVEELEPIVFERLERYTKIFPYLVGTRRMLDLGCHFGEFSIGVSNMFPAMRVIGVDFSNICLAQAERFKISKSNYPQNVNFFLGEWDSFLEAWRGSFDAVFAGELMEHISDTQYFVSGIEGYAKEGGIIALTVPSGPWEWQSFHQDGKRFHIHHFELSDLKEIFGTKRNCFIEYLPFSINKKREFLGNWIIVYQKGSGPTGKINSLRKKITTRPFTEAAKALNCSNGSQGSVVI